jgi:succinyldiaminopimelate transaminase
MASREPFVPPVYPFDKLAPFEALANELEGGVVDLSVGAPVDAPLPAVLEALASSGQERGYPASIGSGPLRTAARQWMQRRLDVDVPVEQIAACIGTKELVAGLPHWLHLRDPSRDTVLYPAVSYPTYEMGALLAGLRAVRVPVDDRFRLDVSQISEEDAARSLVLWSNSPGNPAGNIDDLESIVSWGRAHDVLVASDECYVEFTWDGPRRTALEWGTDGVLAMHSISKRSNLAGVRCGFYAGDAGVVTFVREVRKHAGFMVPGPVQHAAAVALADDEHVARQASIYRRRLERFAEIIEKAFGIGVALPGGGIYLWIPAPDGDAWGFTERLAREGGALVSPGDFYGPDAAGYVRIAMVQPDDRLELVASRLGV